MDVDYSLYLVTDSTDAILGRRNLPAVVRSAIEGGVTFVQYRDKKSDTSDLIRIAKEIHKITKEHGVPLVINDRVDVALAVGCEGVHIGQDDMADEHKDLASTRKLLGPKAIIGVTASSVAEALEAAKGGADYLGLGTVFATPTKSDTKSIVGPAGIQDMLDALHKNDHAVKTVCIGGINSTNCQRVLYQSQSPNKALDGVAVVSAIIAACDPTTAARELKSRLAELPPWASNVKPQQRTELSQSTIQERAPIVLGQLKEKKPICHNMTNLVVQNFAANVAICIGASPIMSNNAAEAADLASLGGSLVINMGTVTKESLNNYAGALTAYNAVGGPVLFDPVGVGATQVRKDAAKQLLRAGYFSIMKGNVSEISTLASISGLEISSQTQQRGVDSGPNTLTIDQRATIARDLAAREHNVVLMTGTQDILSDGHRTLIISNGHEYLGAITGSGCTLGTTVAAFAAAYKEDVMLAALSGLLVFEIAAENAARRADVKGPGTFVPAFLDELYAIQKDDGSEWAMKAKVAAWP